MSTFVRVVQLVDEHGASRVVRLGVVKRLLHRPVTGEDLDDPGVIVRFGDGFEDLFWREELERAHR